jgi:putative ABC transport system permease protein
LALPVMYNYRHLLAHKTTSILTTLVIAAVVGLSCWLLSFSDALESSLAVAADESKILVLKQGASSESNSSITIEDFHRLDQLTGVKRNPKTGQALISPEMMVQVYLPRLRDGGKTNSNVAVRGVTEVAFDVHTNVRIVEGRRFSVATPEVVVGVQASKQFGGLLIGDTIALGSGDDRDFTVVGHFSADSGPMESEIWGYLPALMNASNRESYSAAYVRVKEGVDPAEVIERITGPSIELKAETEADYWRLQSLGIRGYLFVASLLAAVMGVAAVLSIANTMYATVAGRTQEVAMLRTIGYPRRAILASFLVESAMLSLAGGILGCLGCILWLAIVGNTKDMFGFLTFTTLAFEISLTPKAAAIALVSVTLVGMGGSLFPAWRAARTPVVSALREP